MACFSRPRCSVFIFVIVAACGLSCKNEESVESEPTRPGEQTDLKSIQKPPADQGKPADEPGAAPKVGRQIRLGVTTSAVGGLSAVVANKGLVTQADSIFARRNLSVDLSRVQDGAEALTTRFAKGEFDIILDSVDHFADFYTRPENRELDLKVFFQTSWSRGNLGLVARQEITELGLLNGKSVATTPSGLNFLLWLNDLAKIKIKPLMEDPKSGAKLKTAGQVRDIFLEYNNNEYSPVVGAFLFEPDLSQTKETAFESHLLITTADATHLVAGVLIARNQFLHDNANAVADLLSAWLTASQDLRLRQGTAVQILQMAVPNIKVAPVLDQTRLADYVDNRILFELEEGPPPTFRDLYEQARKLLKAEKLGREPGEILDTAALQNIHRDFIGSVHTPDVVMRKSTDCVTDGKLLKVPAKIPFATNSHDISPDAQAVLDEFAKDYAGVLQNMYICVVGHTDNRGSADFNLRLSKARADSVVAALSSHNHLNPLRFSAIGKGSADPIVKQNTSKAREQNRRTEFYFSYAARR